MNQLKHLLLHYEHLFQNVSDYESNAYPCNEVAFDIINEPDFYGTNCSGSQQIYMLFFTGSSDYFPAVWINNQNDNDDKQKWDEMPVYILDFSSDEKEFKSIGNVKQYIFQILHEIIRCSPDMSDKKDAKELILQLDFLSDHVINKGNYCLKSI